MLTALVPVLLPSPVAVAAGGDELPPPSPPPPPSPASPVPAGEAVGEAVAGLVFLAAGEAAVKSCWRRDGCSPASPPTIESKSGLGMHTGSRK